MIAAAIFLVLGAPVMVSAQTGAAAGYRDIDNVDVFAASGERIGEVEDVLINASGRVTAVTVDLSGSFEEVIIELDKLRFENNRYMTALTKEQIQALPKWDD
jgi:hypothetical protein